MLDRQIAGAGRTPDAWLAAAAEKGFSNLSKPQFRQGRNVLRLPAIQLRNP
jgi:hypothetical protein